MSTLRKTAADVAELQVDLTKRLALVAEKQVATNALLEEIGRQRADADVQNELAQIEADKASAASGNSRFLQCISHSCVIRYNLL